MSIKVIDSHTQGEPTRLILDGGPSLGSGSMAAQRQRFAERFDTFRSAVVNEPRGTDALVGALLCEPEDSSCTAGVIFFNNAGYLGMCGHAAIGTAVSLAHVGRIGPGRHRFETPVGVVTVDLENEHKATVENVECYRYREAVTVRVDGLGIVTGDIAWGGNWFFLASEAPCPLIQENIPELLRAATAVKNALSKRGIRGADGSQIDHIEFFGPPQTVGANSRNFVLCPGGSYDRSPCGTGTSAKLACLAASGDLSPGEVWVQESIVGSHFEAKYRQSDNGGVIPQITGHAYVHSEATLLRHPDDPFAHGIRVDLNPHREIRASAAMAQGHNLEGEFHFRDIATPQ